MPRNTANPSSRKTNVGIASLANVLAQAVVVIGRGLAMYPRTEVLVASAGETVRVSPTWF